MNAENEEMQMQVAGDGLKEAPTPMQANTDCFVPWMVVARKSRPNKGKDIVKQDT